MSEKQMRTKPKTPTQIEGQRVRDHVTETSITRDHVADRNTGGSTIRSFVSTGPATSART